MITKQFLSTCTDEQINKGVAWLESKKLGLENPCEFMSYDNDLIFKDGEYSFSPCTNPNDAMPIAFANEISLMRDWERSGMYTAIGTRSEVRSLGEHKKPIEITIKNPLRAAMEVYILMSAEK